MTNQWTGRARERRPDTLWTQALGAGLAAALALGAAGAHAQDKAPAKDGLTVSGSIRLRYEALDGQVKPGFNAREGAVNLRTTLFGEYRRGPFRVGAEVYDSRLWGADRRSPITTSEVNTLEPVQAYVGADFKSRALGPVSLEAGRMLLNLGSRRLVAADDYRNTTNSYTGVKADIAPGGVHATLIYVLPVVRLPDGIDALVDNRQHPDRENRELELWGGTAARPRTLGGATLEGTYFHLTERDGPNRPTRDRALDTYGGRLILDPRPDRFDYELEVLAQTGSISRGLLPNDPKLGVEAGFVHADLGYSFVHPLRPRLSAEFDWASGDRGGSKFNRFDTLFGMRRADFAVSGLYAVLQRANLVTPGLRLELAPKGPWDGFVTVRGLWLQSARDSFATSGVRDPSGGSGTYAGAQVEGRARYWLVKDRLRAEVDGAWLAKGRFLTDAPNAPRTGGEERYVSLNLTGQF